MIKNILFDLGGVLLDLDQQKCMDSFKNLGANNLVAHINSFGSKGIFGGLEIGETSEEEFYNQVRATIHPTITNAQIKEAWNNFLVDFPSKRIDLLKSLQADFKLYILSNTNPIHVKTYENMFFAKAGFNIQDLFVKIFYSNEIGLAKPSVEIFEYVIKTADIQPIETVFIDDAKANIDTAIKLGFNTIHIDPTTDEVADFDFANIEKHPKFKSVNMA